MVVRAFIAKLYWFPAYDFKHSIFCLWLVAFYCKRTTDGIPTSAYISTPEKVISPSGRFKVIMTGCSSCWDGLGTFNNCLGSVTC
eukprot:767282-Pleurochrysis_carterae.AAC.1